MVNLTLLLLSLLLSMYTQILHGGVVPLSFNVSLVMVLGDEPDNNNRLVNLILSLGMVGLYLLFDFDRN